MRRRLLVWLLSAVLVGGLAAAAVVFLQARSQANQLFDYQLRQLALSLRDRSFTASQLAEALQGQDFMIQVWAPDGRLLYHSHRNVDLVPAEGLGFTDVETPQGTWRVFSFWHRGLTIQVAQHRLAREALAFGAAWRTLLPFLLALPLMGLLIWRLVAHEVRFLEATAQAVARRSPESLDPIGTDAVPDEVRPLVQALNGLLGRLGGALAQQRQFIADAAHELRTPLTALRLQLQLAERARDAGERERAHAMLREGIARAGHVVEQLLALARADPQSEEVARAAVDLSELAAEVARDHAFAAQEKGRSVTFDAPGAVVVEGDRASLRSLMDNLVDNAVRYGGESDVRLTVRHEGGEALFEVEDRGPGIAAAERERVFDRFYRGESAAEGGSGLGLAIVRRIAQRHGGRVELLEAPGGRGLLARVRLPCAGSAGKAEGRAQINAEKSERG